MKKHHTFWWLAGTTFLTLILFVSALVFLFWHQLSPEEKRFLIEFITHKFVYVFVGGIVFIAGIGILIDWIIRFYIIPIRKLAEAVGIIYSVNPSHRARVEGNHDIMQLAEKINQAAASYEHLEKSVFKRVDIAKAELEEEKNILAAVLAELPEGVIVCNKDGYILLYNSQAKRFFSDTEPEMEKKTGEGKQIFPMDNEERFVGLGRSAFDLIDRYVLQHALEEIHTKLERAALIVVANFSVTIKRGQLLKAEAVPILNPQGEFSGFVILFKDITRGLESEYRFNNLLEAFKNRVRHSAASIRSAIEIIMDYPEMENVRLDNLKAIIRKESEIISRLIHEDYKDTLRQMKTEWPIVATPLRSLVHTFIKRVGEKLGIFIGIDGELTTASVRIDTYIITLTLIFLVEKLSQERAIRGISCRTELKNGFIYLDMVWTGQPIKIETLRNWNRSEIRLACLEEEGAPLMLDEVLRYHDAEIWSYADAGTDGRAYLRLCLPMHDGKVEDDVRQIAVLPESRPEFYDFDLFNQPGQNPDVDRRKLNELTYTVFDTETTGLDPGGGDRIIAIAAIRIVNLRQLTGEIFDQLIDPERGIPVESTRIHGISDEMVKNKPGIGKVLPMFHRFAQNTVLVAHNAAFDMRMLQVSEADSGIRFVNPVLDTLLLSSVVHPSHSDQDISAIAERLGVEVHKRHTAMGDAMTTCSIFLKLIPLLADMGIVTLMDAREASRRTYYARLKY